MSLGAGSPAVAGDATSGEGGRPPTVWCGHCDVDTEAAA